MQQNNIDDYTVFYYCLPCPCTEMHHLVGMLSTKCEEIDGDENAIQNQLVANAIECVCIQTSRWKYLATSGLWKNAWA